MAAEPTLVTLGRTFFACFSAVVRQLCKTDRSPAFRQHSLSPNRALSAPASAIDFNMCHTIWLIITQSRAVTQLILPWMDKINLSTGFFSLSPKATWLRTSHDILRHEILRKIMRLQFRCFGWSDSTDDCHWCQRQAERVRARARYSCTGWLLVAYYLMLWPPTVRAISSMAFTFPSLDLPREPGHASISARLFSKWGLLLDTAVPTLAQPDQPCTLRLHAETLV